MPQYESTYGKLWKTLIWKIKFLNVHTIRLRTSSLHLSAHSAIYFKSNWWLDAMLKINSTLQGQDSDQKMLQFSSNPLKNAEKHCTTISKPKLWQFPPIPQLISKAVYTQQTAIHVAYLWSFDMFLKVTAAWYCV
jgi:hypothetical protein